MTMQTKTNWQILGRLIMAPLMGLGLVVGLPILGFWCLGRAILERQPNLSLELSNNLTTPKEV